jgi:DNA invertase Pin-like site-specific DNA recombinase
MIAAIYARKSTEQAGVSEDDKSVTRQVEHARAYAIRKGWTVLDAHVYVDDGISGAEFIKRPGFLRLMNALRPRAPFQCLVMSEESRLGREQIETAWAIKQIIDAGVRLFCYLEDKEPTLDTALGKFLLSATNFAAEVEREKASQRTYDALRRKAEAGHVTGGRVYGYDNVAVFAETPGPASTRQRLYVTRTINPAQAAVVQRKGPQWGTHPPAAARGQGVGADGHPGDRLPAALPRSAPLESDAEDPPRGHQSAAPTARA